MHRFLVLAGLLAALVGMLPATGHAQQQGRPNPILGTWKFDLKQGKKQGPRTVIVRADSSASYGTETVRWRLKGEKTLLLALGGEWVEYGMRVRGNSLTLSGGDLTEPITFEKIGPPTPRPETVRIPADPDTES